MSFDLGMADLYSEYHMAELRREADMERLARRVIGPARPARARIAEWLVALAERIEDSQRESTATAQA